ncbi:MAG: VanZ family protein [Pseudomonadota bacterium]
MTRRALWLAAGWGGVVTVIWLSLTPHPPEPLNFDGVDKLEHLTAYGCLMLWFCVVYCGRARLIAGLLLVTLGIVLEILQGWGGVRYFEYADMVANSTGVLLGVWLASAPLAKRMNQLSAALSAGIPNRE